MAKFKKGDRVRAIAGDSCFYNVGDVGTVDEDGSTRPFIVGFPYSTKHPAYRRIAAKESNLELIKEDKVRKLKTGDRVACKISGDEIKDAKVYVQSNDTIYICQDKRDGDDSPDKLGYKFSWTVYPGDINDIKSFNGVDNISELRFFERTVADSQVGDILLNDYGSEVTVVFNNGKYIITADTYDDSYDSSTYEVCTSRLSVPEEKDTTKELTMDEIAEKFGVDVKDLKIKKD